VVKSLQEGKGTLSVKKRTTVIKDVQGSTRKGDLEEIKSEIGGGERGDHCEYILSREGKGFRRGRGRGGVPKEQKKGSKAEQEKPARRKEPCFWPKGGRGG